MPELRIDFTMSGNSKDYIRSGWYAPESGGIWTAGRESLVRIPRPIPARNFKLTILARPFVHGDLVKQQEFSVTVNGADILHVFVERTKPISFDIPDSAISASDMIDIMLKCPDAAAPSSLQLGHDVRLLAFCVFSITIEWQGAAVAPTIAREPARAPRVAAVTMVYNEEELLPIWLNNNAKQVGMENCFVVDHGSDDGSTLDLHGATRLRIPRSPYDPHKQSAWNSDFCSSLLHWYDYVIYSDVDEIIVVDPKIAPSIQEFCRLPLPEISNVIGLNVQHVMQIEPDIDFTLPILRQRPYSFFCSPMCKPLLIRRKVAWSPGSHSADAPVEFNHLYAFHLRWCDVSSGLKRLKQTREMEWARLDAGAHARVQDDKMVETYNAFAKLPRMDDVEFDPSLEPLRSWLHKVEESQAGREDAIYKISLSLWPTHLWHVPPRFLDLFSSMIMALEPERLQQFCARYGLDHDWLGTKAQPVYSVQGTTGLIFDGQIKSIQLVNYGRLGNRFYQVLHATIIACLLGCDQIEMEPFAGGPNRFPVNVRNLRYALTDLGTTTRAKLVGPFFTIQGFEPIIALADDSMIEDTVTGLVTPLFADLINITDTGRADELVLSFRGGRDIFPEEDYVGSVHPLYVQPPASYYIACIEFAKTNLGVTRFRVVPDDGRNPSVRVVEEYLSAKSLPFEVQQSGLSGDFAALNQARHLDVPYTTFTEAAAALSTKLVSYFAFRRLATHDLIHADDKTMLLRILHYREVQCFLVTDTEASYTPEGQWHNTPEQRLLMTSYPVSALHLKSLSTQSAPELMSAQMRLYRDALSAVRNQNRRLEARLAEAKWKSAEATENMRAAQVTAARLQVLASEFGWEVNVNCDAKPQPATAV